MDGEDDRVTERGRGCGDEKGADISLGSGGLRKHAVIGSI
jgi:hypothetical protein